jgi:hypothetical protein
MRDQDPRLVDAGAPIGPGGEIGMDDQPEAAVIPGRAPDQRPDRRQIVGPGPVMVGGKGQGRELAHRQHRRDAGIEEVRGSGFRVAEDLAKPHQARRQHLADPAARSLDQSKIAFDTEPGPEVRGAQTGIIGPLRHQQVTAWPRRARAATVLTVCSWQACRPSLDHIKG